MNYSKISNIASDMMPSEWNGKFEENKITENITFTDGSKMSLVFELESPLEKMFNKNVEIAFIEEDVDEYEDEENDEEIYVMVEENGKSFPIHKDVLDVYLQMMEVNNNNLTEESNVDGNDRWTKRYKGSFIRNKSE